MAQPNRVTHAIEQPWRPRQRHLAQRLVQQILIQENQPLARPFEAGHRAFLALGNVVQKLAPLGRTEFARVSLAVKGDGTARPPA